MRLKKIAGEFLATTNQFGFPLEVTLVIRDDGSSKIEEKGCVGKKFWCEFKIYKFGMVIHRVYNRSSSYMSKLFDSMVIYFRRLK